MISKISFEDGDSLIFRVVASVVVVVVEAVVAIVAVVARIFKSIALVVVVPKKIITLARGP